MLNRVTYSPRATGTEALAVIAVVCDRSGDQHAKHAEDEDDEFGGLERRLGLGGLEARLGLGGVRGASASALYLGVLVVESVVVVGELPI